MNAMRGIYLRSLLLLFGLAALVAMELLAPPAAGSAPAARAPVVGAPHRPA
jgi:hypothetical protein